ncbi:MAG: hypothetical protein RLZZ332_949, partial [Actinomycetota bacterium]
MFLTADGELSIHPHWLPRELALVLASNQQLIMGTAAEGSKSNPGQPLPKQWPARTAAFVWRGLGGTPPEPVLSAERNV